jgi:anaerobic selenocysteine-containing dehydrogenase
VSRPIVIRTTAREMARAKPATLIHPGRRAAWYGDDAQRSRAIALLNALMGNWGRKGGFYVPNYIDLAEYPGRARLSEIREGQGGQSRQALAVRIGRRSPTDCATRRSPASLIR